MKTTRLLLPLAILALLAACAPDGAIPEPDSGVQVDPEDSGTNDMPDSGDVTTPDGGGGGGGMDGGDVIAPEFDGGGQTAVDGGANYPGPYGVGIASIIPNYQFLGFPRPNIAKTTLKKIELRDFYNPTGTEVFPAGSPYGAGVAKPKALLLIRSAVWCGPCNFEAGNYFPMRHLMYAPAGEFMEFLDDGPVVGTAATTSDLVGWATKYHMDFPGILNPAATLSEIVGIDAYPGHVIVRTKDMKIITWGAGTADAALWKVFEDVIAGKPVLPGE